MSTLTVITPIGPGADLAHLRATLESVATSYGRPFQWRYAVTADHAEAVAALADDLGLEAAGIITAAPNIAATRNLLAAMGTGDYLLAADADDAFAPGALAYLAWVLDTRPDLVAAHGASTALGAPWVSRPPAWFATFPADTAAPGVLARRRAAMAAATAAFQGTTEVLAGYPFHPSAGLFRRAAVLAAGGWDEELGNYAEAATLIARLQRAHAWHVATHPVVHLRRVHHHGLEDRTLTLGTTELARVNAIIDAHEAGRPHEAPAPPWSVPYVDRAPRPVLGPDGETLEIPAVPAGGERPAMSLVEKFVTPLIERDEAAKTDAEYAAIQAGVAGVDSEDPDDAPPALDEEELRRLLGDPRPPTD